MFTGGKITSRRSTFLLIPVVLASLIVVSGCTTDGGTTTEKAPMTSASDASSSINFPVVTGALGSTPTIVVPKDAPPATLEIKDLALGQGASVQSNSTVTVHYLLMAWKTGAIIDSSWSRGAPSSFPLNQVIPGWQQGMPGMKIGGRRELIVPPSLGYGAMGSGPVGPDETLIFVVDLISIQ
jgi:peptidylprolyl isomerase